MKTTAELREGFLSYFEEKGHKRLPSWPLVPRADDRSTLLTTAGMQPQMPFFLGREQPPALLTTTSQKCFRTPDIDEVGLDGHHLTFFEMLGNFSFGEYFKEGAIESRPTFIRERLELDWSRVWATVHAGDPELGLGEDETARGLWEADRDAARADRRAPEPRRTSGRSAAPGPAGRTPRSTGTGARSTAAASPTARRPARAATASSSSGTSSSWSTSCTRTGR